MRITLRDVAQKAGVSINTVSRALRKCADISPTRRAEIQALARRMGYEPDPALSALAAYRQHQRVRKDYSTLAVVSYWDNPDRWLKSTSSGREFWLGAEERARQHGFHLERFWLGSVGMNARRAGKVLHYRGVRGLILPPLPPDCRRSQLNLEWDNFCVVSLERTLALPNFLYVAPNYYNGMALVWEKLWARGYRRPGLLLNSDNAGRSQHQWEAAMLLEQYRHLGAVDESAILVHPADCAPLRMQKLFRTWFKRNRPDVIIVRSSDVVRLIEAEGKTVPGDCGLVSLNVGDELGGKLQMTGIEQQRRVMGAAAVDLVSNLLLRNQVGPELHVQGMVVDGSWEEGMTLPARTGGVME